MNRRDLFLFLGLQLFAVIWAGLVFSMLESRLIAGALAGGYFVASGLFMVWRSSRWSDKWRALSWYTLLAHVFGVALPMVISRFLQAGLAFESVRIWGLDGPSFHRLSTWVFGAMVLATITDLVRVWRADHLARGPILKE